MSATPLVFNFDTTCLTTSTIASTPIVCATPTPSLSPKRKYHSSQQQYYSQQQYGNYYNYYNDGDDTSLSSPMKRQRMSSSSLYNYNSNSTEDISSLTTPLYRNFGNGISLCNNTKTNKFSNIEEILHFLTEQDDDDVNSTISMPCGNTSTTICDNIAKELMIELSCKNELPELNNVLLDLNDVLRSDADFIL